jgi:replication factor C subunit 1
MNVSVTGSFNINILDPTQYIIHRTVNQVQKLYVGSECNDGRPITESWRYKQAVKLGIPIIRKIPQIAKNQDNTYKNNELFTTKYSPKTVGDIIGHKEQINQITSWLQSWESGVPLQRGVIITGPPGIGKTTTIHLIAKSLHYKVTEYNASDTRSVSVLRGLMALGIKRLIKEVIVMDEIDGLSERGGVGEIADIIRKTQVPIICIANDKPPKLRPILNACIDIKFNRPVKSTIANAMLNVATTEGIKITKMELETLCEKNGNDIRSILNSLEFYGDDIPESSKKDETLRLDIFSATQRLIGNKRLRIDEASNLVFVDYNMVPLMVQEAYIASSKGSLEDVMKASDLLSTGDIMDKRIHQRQDWSLLPHFVNNVASVAQMVSGPAPFQIFPQWLGKNSKRLKHRRWLEDLSSKVQCSTEEMRLDYADPLQQILLNGLRVEKPNIRGVIEQMDNIGVTRDDVMENLAELCLEKIEIPTKVKTAFTREYNKTHTTIKGEKGVKRRKIIRDDDEDEEESEEDEVDTLQEDVEHMEI